ncbi:MAG: carbonic anhydrase family protein [Planctomycetota bacterium]|nr:carbonic anhydrase family protein [Planctomycetota bacterium]
MTIGRSLCSEALEDRTLLTGTIQGQKWLDQDADGSKDASEPYMNGWTIELLDDTGTVVATQVTQDLDIDGNPGVEIGAYQFSGLTAGAYVVREVQQSGWWQSAPDFQTTLNGSGPVSGDWDYSDSDGNSVPGPANWDTVAPTVNGFFQSPLDIPAGTPTVDLDTVLDVHYQPTQPEKVFNNGHTIEAEIHESHDNRIEIGINDKEFELAQFHFHTSSEHTVNGVAQEQELHLVHKSKDGGLSVIGVLLDEDPSGADNATLKPIFDAMSSIQNKDDEIVISDLIDLNALLPTDRSGWFYEGSLTTPPGSQGVNWFVYATPVKISSAQLAAYKAVANHDASHDFDPGNRPVQPLNGRQFNQLNHEVTVIDGLTSGNVNFGNYQLTTIQGQKWHDQDADGVKDASEPYVNGWSVELLDTSGNVVATQLTRDLDIDGNAGVEVGAYQFTGLKPGAYVVREVQLGGWLQSVPDFQTTLNGAGPVSGDWDYSDSDGNSVPGPANWDTVAPTVNGFFQSPIDIPAGTPTVNLDTVLDVHYQPTQPEKVFNNGHTIEAEIHESHDNRIEIGINDKEFELAQFHFHTSSEHTVNGVAQEQELHLVHKSKDGGLSVIGVLLDEDTSGADNVALKPIFDAMSSIQNKNDEIVIPESIDLNALLPTDHSGWFYEGSLTTPPGSQGVNWFVFATPVKISSAQLAAYKAVANHDASHDFDPGNRPVQALNGRQINQLNHEVTALSGLTAQNVNFANYRPLPLIVIGNDVPGSQSVVRIVDPATGADRVRLHPFDSGFQGNVHTAAGDINGDGVVDIIAAAGRGGGPRVQVFDGSNGSILRDFLAYDPDFRGGVYIAAGDVDGDGDIDIITGAGEGGGPHVRVFDGTTGAVMRDFFAFDPAFRGGVRIAAGDVNGDGDIDIVASTGPGAAANVRVFSGANVNTILRDFVAYDPAFLGGSFVAAGDVNGDGWADIITGAGTGGGPHVKVYSGADHSQLASFFAYGNDDRAGVRVAATDVSGDGLADIMVNPVAASNNAPIGFDSGNGFVPTSRGLNISQLGRGFYAGAPTAASPAADVHPEVAVPIRDQTATTGSTYSFTLPTGTFRDRNINDVLTYSATLVSGSLLPTWLTFNATTRTFSGNPASPGDVGTVQVRVTVNDNVSGTASDDFSLTVRDAATPAPTTGRIAIGAAFGASPWVQVLNATDGSVVRQFLAYDPRFIGGVDVAMGDVTGDGVDDIITAAGPSGGPHVKVYDGVSGNAVMSFFAFDAAFRGGVHIATGDVNGDGRSDIIAGAGAGAVPIVRVFSGADGSVMYNFLAYEAGFQGGVDVAAGDVTGDGKADIITGAGPSGGPHVKVFDGETLATVQSFFAYDAGFRAGVSVSAVDTNGDGRADIITGVGPGAAGQVNVFDGQTGNRRLSEFPFGRGFTGGVNVGNTNANNDSNRDVVAAKGSGSGPQISVLDGNDLSRLDDFFAFDSAFRGGALVS